MERYLLRRSLAYTIDALLTIGIISLDFIAIAVGMIVSPTPDELSAGAAVMIGVTFLVTAVVGFGYFLMRDGLRSGSLGKRLAGIRVVDATTGEPCTGKQSFVRNLLLLVIGGFDLLVPFFRQDGKRIRDVVAGTLVERKGAQSS